MQEIKVILSQGLSVQETRRILYLSRNIMTIFIW